MHRSLDWFPAGLEGERRERDRRTQEAEEEMKKKETRKEKEKEKGEVFGGMERVLLGMALGVAATLTWTLLRPKGWG